MNKKSRSLFYLPCLSLLLSTTSRIVQVVDSMEERRYQSGDAVIEEGGPGDFFYVTGSGELEVRRVCLLALRNYRIQEYRAFHLPYQNVCRVRGPARASGIVPVAPAWGRHLRILLVGLGGGPRPETITT